MQKGTGVRVIGIDPGLRCLGWGIIAADGARVRHIANGTIRPRATALAERLTELYHGLDALIATHAPDQAAVEQTFVNRDGAGTLKLGQARGVALLVPALAGLPVGEYAPNAVKKAIVGVGHADKQQVGHMIGLQFPGVKVAGADAADALAIALCHLYQAQSSGRLAAAVAKAGA